METTSGRSDHNIALRLYTVWLTEMKALRFVTNRQKSSNVIIVNFERCIIYLQLLDFSVRVHKEA